MWMCLVVLVVFVFVLCVFVQGMVLVVVLFFIVLILDDVIVCVVCYYFDLCLVDVQCLFWKVCCDVVVLCFLLMFGVDLENVFGSGDVSGLQVVELIVMLVGVFECGGKLDVCCVVVQVNIDVFVL